MTFNLEESLHWLIVKTLVVSSNSKQTAGQYPGGGFRGLPSVTEPTLETPPPLKRKYIAEGIDPSDLTSKVMLHFQVGEK